MTQQKILFLDIDGVLNSERYIKRIGELFDNPDYQIDPEAVSILNKLISICKVDIVLSSTWRLAFSSHPSPIEAVQKMLEHYGITGKVVGVTPSIYTKTGLIYLSQSRSYEIQAWLDEHVEIKDFVILDDDGDMADLKEHLVQTKFEDGIQEIHIVKALRILNKEFVEAYKSSRNK